jgi:PBSX family phage terminase large subunit
MARTQPDLTALRHLVSPKQIRAIAGSGERINILDGPVRSGKTVSTLVRWIIYCASGPPGELLLTGKNLYSVYRNLIIPLQDPALMGPLACLTQYTAGSPSGTCVGRRFHVIGANDIRSENRLRGFTLAGALADEAVLFPREFWNQMLARMSVNGAQLFATTNPDSPYHWLLTDFIGKQDQPGMNLARFRFKLDDNPSLTAEFKASIAAEYTGMLYRRMVLGEWTAAEGAIYDMFDPGVHVVDICPVITRWLCAAVDYGTTNPFHAVLIGLGADRRLYVVAEFRWDSKARHRQLTDAEYVVMLRDWLGSVRHPGSELRGIVPERIVVDPSATSFIAALHRQRMQPHKALNAVGDGIRTVASLLATDRLKIHASCEHLRREITTYVWDDKEQIKGIDAPVKRDDHGVDALRYGLATTRQLWQNKIVPVVAPVNHEDTFDLAGGWR